MSNLGKRREQTGRRVLVITRSVNESLSKPDASAKETARFLVHVSGNHAAYDEKPDRPDHAASAVVKTSCLCPFVWADRDIAVEIRCPHGGCGDSGKRPVSAWARNQVTRSQAQQPHQHQDRRSSVALVSSGGSRMSSYFRTTKLTIRFGTHTTFTTVLSASCC